MKKLGSLFGAQEQQNINESKSKYDFPKTIKIKKDAFLVGKNKPGHTAQKNYTWQSAEDRFDTKMNLVKGNVLRLVDGSVDGYYAEYKIGNSEPFGFYDEDIEKLIELGSINESEDSQEDEKEANVVEMKLKRNGTYLVAKGDIEAYHQYKGMKDGKHCFDNSGKEICLDDKEIKQYVSEAKVNENKAIDAAHDKVDKAVEILDDAGIDVSGDVDDNAKGYIECEDSKEAKAALKVLTKAKVKAKIADYDDSFIVLESEVETSEAQSGGKEEYQKFFDAAVKKFGGNPDEGPDTIPSDKKKEFFNYVDKNWKADDEKDANENAVEGITVVDVTERRQVNEAKKAKVKPFKKVKVGDTAVSTEFHDDEQGTISWKGDLKALKKKYPNQLQEWADDLGEDIEDTEEWAASVDEFVYVDGIMFAYDGDPSSVVVVETLKGKSVKIASVLEGKFDAKAEYKKLDQDIMDFLMKVYDNDGKTLKDTRSYIAKLKSSIDDLAKEYL